MANHTQGIQRKRFHLLRNTAIALILLALLIAGIIAYTESGIGQPKPTPTNIEPVTPQYLLTTEMVAESIWSLQLQSTALTLAHQFPKWAVHLGLKKGIRVS